jgi:hypothetical protein
MKNDVKCTRRKENECVYGHVFLALKTFGEKRAFYIIYWKKRHLFINTKKCIWHNTVCNVSFHTILKFLLMNTLLKITKTTVKKWIFSSVKENLNTKVKNEL